ncbi:MAG: chlorite dismutase family protein [Chloroflexi bacterium]|nr:chlorite dismutase family protein [Chloroflexota bacterium]MCC6891171.1 chlorite dismutase family protein [Anaerolineae bacterium]
MSSFLGEQTKQRPQTTVPNGKGKPTKRQYVRFAFYKLDPEWRRLSPEEQASQKQELVETIETFNRRMLLRPYTLMGTRSDVELLLWQIAESIEPFQELAAALVTTRMGSYLTLVVSYLSQTKRSIYEIRDNPNEDVERLIISPSEAKYLFVYPFVKTRSWYQMSLEQRQAMMDEHIRVGRKYPAVKLNTTYSFGLDDQEFVVAFETDEPSDFLDLVQELRETEASVYTLRDTPLYSGLRAGLAESLDALGGPKIAKPVSQDVQIQPSWTEVGSIADFGDGARKVIYHNGQQVALFNVGGRLYALNNRCSHARGPLSEGEVQVSPETCSVTCPWHYAKYDLATGEVVDGIASAPVATYSVDVRDGVIFVGNA